MIKIWRRRRDIIDKNNADKSEHDDEKEALKELEGEQNDIVDFADRTGNDAGIENLGSAAGGEGVTAGAPAASGRHITTLAARPMVSSSSRRKRGSRSSKKRI